MSTRPQAAHLRAAVRDTAPEFGVLAFLAICTLVTLTSDLGEIGATFAVVTAMTSCAVFVDCRRQYRVAREVSQ